MINTFHSERVWKLLDDQDGNIIYKGGNPDLQNRFIPPVILLNPDLNSSIMNEEIFGPILVILTYSSESEVFNIVNDERRKNPLNF